MKKQIRPAILALLPAAFLTLIALPSAPGPAMLSVRARPASPTPTYDPLAQPPLPPEPTEYEFGRYLYWRHCMPCHGDRGQGLTDEFRAVWVKDHQNCWARGCHSGKYAQDSFYVPTVVPAVVTADGLAHFATRQNLLDYLKATHPPQDPGFLEEDEYRALALFVFTMNDRSAADSGSTDASITPNRPAPVFTPTSILPPPPQVDGSFSLTPLILVGLIVAAVVIALQLWTKFRAPRD